MPLDVSAVAGALRMHLQEVKTVADLARILDIPKDSLRKKFKAKTGSTLHPEIVRVKIDKAKRLLATTNLRCFEICNLVGLAREDSGARLFKQKVGVTMGTYRRCHSNQESNLGMAPTCGRR